ncbi:enoyl-CoA hydratase-like protein [Naegleria gruberi]|uniref:Enoyl-CoA hydratase-like protein n=1 Tax=Naegleria gruberi TaxID=5762 RepID=D2VXJ0_NAEGR|nr:enoyl-CoA hydratase-like protein [Naegleria gruberi]EFC38447.1 enoyl-CoA hydratase-like protein [Naegleria gruberi]|eukprot:XP_002671191.1 enoyl-CoA hydratase-like protein [Naegleria gruberi strain NEG-M]
MVNELLSCLEFIKFNHTEQGIRCLIINSAVKGTFCAGADLKERSQMTQTQTSQFVTKLRNLMNDIENLPIPTIAAINGYCLGGGMELSLACDFRVGVQNKDVELEKLPGYYGLVETALAIIPGAGGTQRLPRLIGVPKAKELIYTAKKINVQEAYEKYGILNDYGKPISQNGPIAVKMAKQSIQQGIQLDLANAMKTEELCYAQVIPTKDRIEGLTAFREKRKPVYKGE